MPVTHNERIAFASPDVQLSAPSHATLALASLREPDEQPAPCFVDVCKANAEVMLQEARIARPGFWREFCVRQARMWRRLERTAATQGC